MLYGIVAANDPVNKIDPSGKEFTMVGTLFSISLQQTLAVGLVAVGITALILDRPVRMFRYFSSLKLQQTLATGIVAGTLTLTWWTNEFYPLPEDAKDRLSLKYEPEAWISVYLYQNRDALVGGSSGTVVKQKPEWGTNGGGREWWTIKPILIHDRFPQWGYYVIPL